MTLRPSSRIAMLAALGADARAAGSYTTGWIDLSELRQVAAVLCVGEIASGGSVTAALEQAQDGAGTGAKAVPGAAATALTQAGGDGDSQSWIECSAEALDLRADYTHVRLSVTVADAAADCAALLYGVGPRYGPARALNAASVAEIVTTRGAGSVAEEPASPPSEPGGGDNAYTITTTGYTTPVLSRIADSGRHANLNRAYVPVPPLAAGTAPDDAAIEARIVRSDTKAAVTSYASVGSLSGGSLPGAELHVMSDARKDFALDMEIRVVGSSESVYAGEFRIGTNVLGQAQSEFFIWSTTGSVEGATTPASYPADAGQVVVARYDSVTTTGGAGTAVTATDPGVYALAAGSPGSLGGMNQSVAEVLKHGLTDYFLLQVEPVSGTGQVQIVDDANAIRRWADFAAFMNETGISEGWVPGVVLMPWWQNLKSNVNAADMLHSLLTGRRLDGSTCATGQTFTLLTAGSATTTNYDVDRFYFDLSGQGRGVFDSARTQLVMVVFGGEAIQTVAQGGGTLLDQGTTLASPDALGMEAVKRVLDTVFATSDAQQIGRYYAAPWPMLWGPGTPGVSGTLGIHQNDSLDGEGLLALWIGHMVAGALNIHAHEAIPTTVTVAGDKSSCTISSPAGALTSSRVLMSESLPADGNEHRVPAQGLSLFGVPAAAGEAAFSGGNVIFSTPAVFNPALIPDVCYRPLINAGPGGGSQHVTEDFAAETWKDRIGVSAATLGLPAGALNLPGLGDVVVPLASHRGAQPVPAAYAACPEVDLTDHYYLGPLASSFGTVSSFFLRAIFTPDLWDSADGWGVMGWVNSRGALTVNRQFLPQTNFSPAGAGGSIVTEHDVGLIWPGTRNVVEMSASLAGAASTCAVRFNGRAATHGHVFGANYTQVNVTGTSALFFGGSASDGLVRRPLHLHSFQAWINQTDDSGAADISLVADGSNAAAILAQMTAIP